MKPLWDILTWDYPDLARDLDQLRSLDEFRAWAKRRRELGVADDALKIAGTVWAHRDNKRMVYDLSRVVEGLLAVPPPPPIEAAGTVFFMVEPTSLLEMHMGCGHSHKVAGAFCDGNSFMPLLHAHGEVVILPWIGALYGDLEHPDDGPVRGFFAAAYAATHDERLSVQTRYSRAHRMHRAAIKSRATVRRVELTPDYRAHWRTLLVGDACHPEQPEERAPCRMHTVQPHTYRAWVKPGQERYQGLEEPDVEPRAGKVAVRLPRRGCVRGKGEPMPARVAHVVAPREAAG